MSNEETKGIGCGKYDNKQPELMRGCGDILFNNKIWLCEDCGKKKYTPKWEKVIQR